MNYFLFYSINKNSVESINGVNQVFNDNGETDAPHFQVVKVGNGGRISRFVRKVPNQTLHVVNLVARGEEQGGGETGEFLRDSVFAFSFHHATIYHGNGESQEKTLQHKDLTGKKALRFKKNRYNIRID